jgi:uncharacterized protein (UPF0548 family)
VLVVPSSRARVHAAAHASSTHPPVSWLDDPPPGYDVLRRSTAVAGLSLEDAGDALLGWSIHRAAGLRIVADGRATPGRTVVVGVPLGPDAWAAPCRVIAVSDDEDRVGFTYATLPGHPEHGVESFRFERVDGGVTFSVEAVSRPSLRIVRLVPAVAERAQCFVTERYLHAARELGTG